MFDTLSVVTKIAKNNGWNKKTLKVLLKMGPTCEKLLLKWSLAMDILFIKHCRQYEMVEPKIIVNRNV